MIEDDDQLLTDMLSQIIGAFDQILQVIVMDRTGFLVKALSRDGLDDQDLIMKISAIFPAMFAAGEEQGSCFEFGDIVLQMTEYQNGLVFGVSAGAGVLCVATKNTVPFSQLIHLLKQFQPRIADIIEHYLCAQDTGNMDDIRMLFSSGMRTE
jgi:predicted regulator of Ras-like GTPase activity (Roadblock/LC7/MglB family)